MELENNVKVAVRIRPQVPKEIIEMCSICTSVVPNEPQIWLGKDKAFTFDYVFDQQSEQGTIYDTCVKTLVEGCLEGYNATVVAYGQTGSGKTHTMGTGFDLEGKPEEKGIIPRAVEHLFAGIRQRQSDALDNGSPVPEFKINAQFLELYNEDIIDLLADERTKHSQIKVHEDANGGIYTVGAASKTVTTVDATLQCLKKGALSRSTASTQMNTQSSRSHAIFTLHIKQQRVVTIRPLVSIENGSESTLYNGENDEGQEFETLTAKFHFVDLAGSERLKRTGATGDRQKEGISINSGLLALGNVISALGDKTKRALHVPYRDSKLTRLLQDSLGGNSRTLMIACISPSDRDFMETLNTLRYANRAKNIQNRVTANQDKSSQTIMSLRREIQQLQLELMEYKQGKRLIGEDGSERINDMYHENTMLQTTINNLNTRLKALLDAHERLVARNTELLTEKECGKWISSGDSKSDIGEIIHGYVHQIEDLRSKLIEMEETCSQLRKQLQKYQNRMTMSPYSTTAIAITGHYDIGPDLEPSSVEEVLDEAKKDVEKMKKVSRSLFSKPKEGDAQDTNGNEIAEDNASVNGDEADNESEVSTDEDSDDEEKRNNENELELVELTNEITVKEKLIMELEKSQRKLNTMRQQYEDKLLQLQHRITEIESERDQVLSKLSSGGCQPNEKEAKKVRADYEKRIAALQSEMKKLQLAKKQHAQAMKNQAQHELQLKQLKNDVNEMKKQKVRLLNKMKEEAQKHREADLKNSKRIAQLTKQERAKDVKIKNLELEKNRAKQLLKRKDEEVNALKRRIKPMSDMVAGRLPNSTRARASVSKNPAFSPKVAKQKWQRLEQTINKLVLSKQSIAIHEKRMERFLHQRDQVSHSLDKAMKKLQAITKSGREDAEVQELYEEIDSHESHINYLNQNINECQSTIVQIEDTKDDTDVVEINTFLNSADTEDMKYLFEKLLAMAINQSLLASQKEEEKKEYELKYKQCIDNSLLQESLLHHVLETTFMEESGMFADEYNPPDLLETREVVRPSIDLSSKAEKARRRTRTPQELLFLEDSRPSNDMKEDPMTKSLYNPMSFGATELHRVPSAPSLKENEGKLRPEASPATRRKNERNQEGRRFNKSTSLSVAGNSNSNAPQSYASRQISMDLSDTTPPASPPTSRRNRDDNVFSRLTSGTNTNNPTNPDRGVMNPYAGKVHKNAPLVCTHIAEGHSRPVLSVCATNDVMFSGSKDCTAKIWDLQTGTEIQSLDDHPDSVVVVRYNEYNRLAFSVSKSICKVWDPRDNPARCIKILHSSGLASAPQQSGGIHKSETNSGESRILDVQISLYGNTLFSTCSQIVRVWDLRMFYCVGKLNTNHTAPIMCMCVEEIGVDNNLVVTGSKDHYIKVFEVMEGVGGIHNPKMTCTPPHYDGIEALAITGDFLFSASRDACIKKWDLSRQNQKLVQSVNQAHKDWIHALGISSFNNLLISGCRSGYIKLWSIENFQLRSEMKAHQSAIHSIDTNMSLVFTASADNTVGLWKWKTGSDPSPELNEANYNDL